ncbi:protein-arginine deiminase family protein, partial [Myxococcus vastator]|uniref:protein-arginine deiminase family protein n=1 Tax=Myxococcus vastator TaxID=2709664 RepID=UPI0030846D1F
EIAMPPSPPARARLLPLWLACLLASACGSLADDEGGRPRSEDPLEGPFHPVVDLRADVNRNGTVELDSPTEDEGEDTWTAERGAIFLANLDDDEDTCPFSMDPHRISDDALAQCHDAMDDVVNGESDLEDLARLRTVPWPEAPAGTVGSVTVAGAASKKVRLFKRVRGTFVSTGFPDMVFLTTAEVRRGVVLAIEGRDIVRDPEAWDGFADVVLTIGRNNPHDPVFTDTVRMRVAPVVLFHHLTPAWNVFVSKPAASIEANRFRQALGGVLADAGARQVYSEFAVDDLWPQDYFEPAYMSMPAPGGRQHVMRVNYRAPHVYNTDANAPLRAAGRIAFWLRGPDNAAIQQYQQGMSMASQTLNSFGNTEVIPPYVKDGVTYPLGRLLRGRGPDTRPDYQPDPSFTKLLEAQAVQPPIYVDTSWLFVDHVDETFTFLPAPTPRGWMALVADPALARRMLQDAQARGHGDAKLFAGLSWAYSIPAETRIAEVLDNPELMDASAVAALEIDTQLSILREETGLTDADILRVPFLFQNASDGVTAYQPATLNLLSLTPTEVVAPDPHGPLIDGRDPFKTRFEEALGAHGIRVHWVDAWAPFHIAQGDVHCATQSARQVPDVKWWEGGR